MYVFDGRRWRDGFPDYHLAPGRVRVSVRSWHSILPITDAYSGQPRDWRLLWNYLWKIGPRALARKVLARSREGLRNRRVMAIGLGTVCQADAGGTFGIGDSVVFIAPCHPPCVERVVLPKELLAVATPALTDRLCEAKGIRYVAQPVDPVAEQFAPLRGWNEHSGHPLPDSLPALLERASQQLLATPAGATRILPLPESSPMCEVLTPPRQMARSSRLRAVVFGLGNHAKTVLLPNTGPHIGVERIHEVDPTQINEVYRKRFTVDTSPSPREDEAFDVYFIAGFHHTHADLAAHALRRGAWAVVEKPLVTTERQLDTLLTAVRENPGRLFSGFHKRYNPLWTLARQDLGTRPGEPIHLNCLIYEVSLPRLHWYTWPNSRSRVVSNGCHWLDLFLFLNDFARPARYDLWLGCNLDVHMSVELENGACMIACLTDTGSRRLGTQDMVEARAGGVTVRVQNDSAYFAEDSRKVLRRCRRNSIRVFATMYRAIAEKIVRGEKGDTYESVERTSRLMLDMDRLFFQKLPPNVDHWASDPTGSAATEAGSEARPLSRPMAQE